MSVIAIYENGVLRPLKPLVLPEHTRVQIQVEKILTSDDIDNHRLHVREVMVTAGLSLADSPPIFSYPISAERRKELANRFSTGRPLSELIIAERDER